LRKRGSYSYRRLSEHQTGKIRKQTSLDILQLNQQIYRKRILKAAREKQQVITYESKPIRITSDFSTETKSKESMD
jgi:hypothetical protein